MHPYSLRTAWVLALIFACVGGCQPAEQRQAPVAKAEPPPSDAEAAAALKGVDSSGGQNLLAYHRIAQKYPGTVEALEARKRMDARRIESDARLCFAAIAAMDNFDVEGVHKLLDKYQGPEMVTRKAILAALKEKDYLKAAAAHRDEMLTTEAICKAGIAVVMGRDPRTMTAFTSAGEVHISYIRPSDGTRWRTKCKLDGSKIIWASDMPTDTGRWRTDPEDGLLLYEISGEGSRTKVTVSDRMPGGMALSTETFLLKPLKSK